MTRTEHLLAILAEELNETSKITSIALRSGLTTIHPGQVTSNAEEIIYKFNDIVAVMEMLQEDGHIQIVLNKNIIEIKKADINKMIEPAKQDVIVPDEKQSISLSESCSVCSINSVEEHDICDDCVTHRL